MGELGPVTEMQLSDPAFSQILWKLTPASMAARVSQGRWHPWPYLQLLSRKLVDVAMGRCKRLIVVMPPRHGKSEMVSHHLPVWYLEMFQRKRVILCSYESEFAAKWGGKARDTIAANQDILTLRFKTRSPAQHHWETSLGGAMMTAGVGGPITGKGADLMIIDDFVKNAEEAASLTMRDKLWDWWLSTARSRLEPGAGVVVMATRWHSDDLIGRLLNPKMHSEKGTKEDWEVFCFPMLAEPDAETYYRGMGVRVNDLRKGAVAEMAATEREKTAKQKAAEQDDPTWRDMLGRKLGEALCPDRYDVKDANLLRGAVNEPVWFALYQQRPGDHASDGNVYHQFSELVHTRPIMYDQRMQLVISMDFNVDPMCATIAQYDPNGSGPYSRVEVLEEIVIHNSNTPQMMDRLIVELRKYQQGRLTLMVQFFGDAAGTQRSSNSARSNWQLVSDHVNLNPWIRAQYLRKKSNPMIVDRVNAVNTMFRAADGSIRMFVDDRKCPELVKDFKKVKWLVDSNGNSTGVLDKTDKDRTHISDAHGYFIDYKFGMGQRSGAHKGVLQ